MQALLNHLSIRRIESKFAPLTGLVALYRTWRKRATEREYLVQSDHRLRIDLLATRQEIESEVSKPFWQS